MTFGNSERGVVKRGLGLIGVVLALGGCGSAAMASPSTAATLPPLSAVVSMSALVDVGVDPSASLSGRPSPIVTPQAAEATALAHAFAGSLAGPVLAIGRAIGHSTDDGSPSRTVWVVVIGPGGRVPLTGPLGGTPQPISYEIAVVDDQTGDIIRDQITSGP